MRRSYGFRTFRILELALYHSLGKLPEPELTHDFFGSAQESDEVRILGGFLESDEFGLGGGHTLRLQQQVVEIAVATTTTQ